MSSKTKAQLKIPAEGAFIEAATNFILTYARKIGVASDQEPILETATRAALEMVRERHISGKSKESISLDIFESQGKFTIQILNRGLPLLFERFHEASKKLDNISIENQGRKGQLVTLEMKLAPSVALESLKTGHLSREEITIPDEDITLRRLFPGEESALSELFYFVYGYDYINEAIYYPEKIKAMVEGGDLISIVASLSNGRLLGHVGLVRKNKKPPVYEAAMGVVDPRVKSRGLFGMLFKHTMEIITKTPMQYCLFDFVTNHKLSHQTIAKYGLCDMALFVGCQSRVTQARLEHLGLGPDPQDMDRYSILLSIIPQVKHPFGQEILLPESIGGSLGYLLEPLGLRWLPTPRFHLLAPVGDYKIHYHPTQDAVVFDLFQPGRVALEKILEHWSQLLRDGYEYAAIEVPIEAPGLGNLYDILSSHGFFASGFVPYHLSDKLGFRFQAIGPTKVAYESIQVATEASQKLLQVVRQDCEANSLV